MYAVKLQNDVLMICSKRFGIDEQLIKTGAVCARPSVSGSLVRPVRRLGELLNVECWGARGGE